MALLLKTPRIMEKPLLWIFISSSHLSEENSTDVLVPCPPLWLYLEWLRWNWCRFLNFGGRRGGERLQKAALLSPALFVLSDHILLLWMETWGSILMQIWHRFHLGAAWPGMFGLWETLALLGLFFLRFELGAATLVWSRTHCPVWRVSLEGTVMHGLFVAF